MVITFISSLSCVAGGVPRGKVQGRHATSAPPCELDRRDVSPTPSSALPLRYLAYLASEVVRCAEMSSALDGPDHDGGLMSGKSDA